jgi:hypothetical protein
VTNSSLNETLHPVDGLQDLALNALITGICSDNWNPFAGIVNPTLLKRSSPWQSLGGYLDYSEWVARDRSVTLDKAIATTSYQLRLESVPGADML